MPNIVPALSWGFVKLRYQTAVREHTQKIHIAELDPTTGAWLQARTGTYPEVYLLDTLDDFISLGTLAYPSGTTFGTVEVFQNQAGPLPALQVATFIVPVPTVAPSGNQSAGCQLEMIFGSTTGQKARHVFKDIWTGQPQRYAFVNLSGTMQTYAQYLLGAGNQITTRDGYAYQFFESMNSNVNRKDARKYGRFVSP